jgi:hypothetical protein
VAAFRFYYLSSVKGDLEAKMLKNPSEPTAKKKLRIARKLRRLYFDYRHQIILCSKRPTLSPTQLLAENNLSSAWRSRAILFDKCVTFFTAISNCKRCNHRCRVNLPRHCFEENISFRNLDFITAADLVMNASCGFENYAESRKDWGIRPKNYNFVPTLPRQLANELAVKLHMSHRALEFLKASETKKRRLPPCGVGKAVWREPISVPPTKQMLITEWAIPLNK